MPRKLRFDRRRNPGYDFPKWRAIGRHWPATAGKENYMDLRKMMAERLKQYQLLIAFAAKQKQAEKQES